MLIGLIFLFNSETVRKSTMIKVVETSAGIVFVQHIVRIEPCSNGSRIYTVDGLYICVNESHDNIMFQICNNRLPQEGELS